MKKIIESIKSNREELICKYSKIKKEIEILSEGIKQAIKLGNDDAEDNLWIKRSDLNSEITEIKMAIKDLTNALNHLGESTEIFWG